MGTIFFKKIENGAAIAAGAIWTPTETDLTIAEVDKYSPFNHLTLYNNSAVNIEIRFYGGNIGDKGTEFVAAGDAVIFDKEDSLKFIRPTIYNRDTAASIAANEIIMQIRRVV